MKGLIAAIKAEMDFGMTLSIRIPGSPLPITLIPNAAKGCHHLSAANKPINQKMTIPNMLIEEQLSRARALVPLCVPLSR